jgi:hypothetical protein
MPPLGIYADVIRKKTNLTIRLKVVFIYMYWQSLAGINLTSVDRKINIS